MKCSFTGCKCRAKWSVRKLFGKCDTLYTCDEHKPDAGKRPPSLRHLPFFYTVTALEVAR